jgi:hypothetical protein
MADNVIDISKAIQQAAGAMTGGANLSTAEQMALRLAPTLAGMYVSMASPSGFIGTAKEAGSVAGALVEAGKNAPAGSLFNTLFASGKHQEDQQELMNLLKSAGSPDAMKTALLDKVKSAVTGLASKGDANQSAAYKNLIVAIATKVAEASKEGGFLGFGGTLVSDAEKNAIADIKRALGM